jgi:glycosyl transferase family 25
MQYIPKVYYINLDSRPERNEQFLEEMKRLKIPEEKLIRVSAVENKEFGIIGCVESHIRILETCIASGDEFSLIFEDDFKSLLPPHFFHHLLNQFFALKKDTFDVFLLEGVFDVVTPTEVSFLYRVNTSYGTAGYCITKRFAPILLENFKQTRDLFYKRSDWKPYEYYSELCLDVQWHTLQKNNIFYTTLPKLGCQREGYSDICYKHKNQSNMYSSPEIKK